MNMLRPCCFPIAYFSIFLALLTLGGCAASNRPTPRPIVPAAHDSALAQLQATATPGEAPAAVNSQTAVTGVVTYRERIALPPDAALLVQLHQLARVKEPGRVIAEQRISPTGQVPIKFTLPYNPIDIKAGRRYGLKARIVRGDKPLFISTDAYPVITQGHPTQVEMVLQRTTAR